MMFLFECIFFTVFLFMNLTLVIYSIQNSMLEQAYEELGILCDKLSSDFRLSQKSLALILALGEIAGERSIGAKFAWATVKSRLHLNKKKMLEEEIGPVIRSLVDNTPKPLKLRMERAIQLCIMILIVRNPITLLATMWQAKIITRRQIKITLLSPITAGVDKFRADFERFVSARVQGALAA